MFFGFLWYFWFSRRICWFCKTFGKTKTKTKIPNPYPRVGLKPFKNFVFFVIPNVCFVFFGFLLYFWFSRRFFVVFSPLQQCLASLCGFCAWFYVSSVVSPARRDNFVTSQGTDSYYLAGTTTTTATTTTTTTTTTTITKCFKQLF